MKSGCRANQWMQGRLGLCLFLTREWNNGKVFWQRQSDLFPQIFNFSIREVFQHRLNYSAVLQAWQCAGWVDDNTPRTHCRYSGPIGGRRTAFHFFFITLYRFYTVQNCYVSAALKEQYTSQVFSMSGVIGFTLEAESVAPAAWLCLLVSVAPGVCR